MPKIDVAKYDQSRFFKSGDVERELKKFGKREFWLTVKAVTEEKMQNGDERMVVWFEEDRRGLVLSAKKNIRRFVEKYGNDDPDDWVGAPIAMFLEQAHNPSTGTDGPALRVRMRENPSGVTKPRKKTTKKKAA
jgi:hypothetical protein